MKKHLTLFLFLITTTTFGQLIKIDKKWQQARFDVLINQYFKQTIDKETLKAILSPSASSINTDNSAQQVVNDDKTKFVAFFVEQFSSKDFNTFRKSKNDRTINIITSEDIMKGGTMEDINTYAFIVKGVKYNDKWYFEKSNVNYFSAKTLNEGQQKFFNYLQGWNFFKKKSIEPNPEFWETMLFEKVQKKSSSDPYWSPYIDQYKIVANSIREEKQALASKKEIEIIDKYITPLKDQLKAQHNYETVTLTQMSRDHLLIYPAEMNVILCPVNVKEKDKDEYIRYFALLPDENNNYTIFEWTYLNPADFKNSHIGPSFMDQINTLTVWNYTFDTLDNAKFWNNYVLIKSGNAFKYLKRVK